MASIVYMPAKKLAKLLLLAGSDKYVWVVGRDRLVLGSDPLRPTEIIELSDESLRPCNGSDATTPGIEISTLGESPAFGDETRIFRRRTAYWFDIRGTREACISLKHLLSEALRAIEQSCPGTLEKLSHIKPRSRRIVARERKDLFDREHLIEQYSERLMDAWWFGTNNSAEETKSWLERACDCAGLKWGRDFKTNLGA